MLFRSYSCLLGRPWIHKAGAVTSTLHHKLKYPVKEKIVIVQGEEEYMVIHLNSFRYVEIDGEFIETPFQHFEEVPQTLASTETIVEGPLLYPKICPLMFSKVFPCMVDHKLLPKEKEIF